MAINPAVVKGVAGVTAVGGTGVVGYVYRGALLDAWNADYQTFIAQATTVSENSDLKEYFCESDSQIDNDCKIIKLNFNDQKHIDGDSIIKANTHQTEKLTKDAFYKLVINKDKIKTFSIEAEKNIVNLKTGSGSASNAISKLQILAEINTSEVEKSTIFGASKILVKADSSFSGDSTAGTLKCKDSTNTNEIDDCKIYKFDAASHKHLFDFSKIKKITKLNEIQAQDYFVIDLSDVAKSKLFVNKTPKINVFESNTSKGSFSTVANIFFNITDTTTGTTNNENNALILSSNFGKNTNKTTYIIAKSETTTQTGFTDTNYKCELSSKTDSNCKIIELTDKEKTLLQITNSEKKPENLNTANKHYKIIVNNEILNAITDWDNTTAISIKSNQSGSSTEYGKLKPLFSIQNEKIVKGKTTLIIADAKDPITKPTDLSTSTTFQCQVNGQTSATDCEIYKFSDTSVNSKNISEKLTGSLSKATSNDDWTQGKVFLIDLKTAKIDHSSTTTPKPNNIKVTVKVTSTSKDIATLTINNHLFCKDSFNESNISNLLALS